ncbi:Zn-dependent hydrolase [Haloplanus sp. GCM10025708]|uniref:Zn-dependent hydrolase n=1 Tax=Haloferacaceae TaxID=1644056 RepID=UPI0036235D5B
MTDLSVDEDRLRTDIETTAGFGAEPAEEGRGRTVLTGTEANREARDYLLSRMEDAGLSVRVDAVGNVAARWVPESADPAAAPVAVGSHVDSVPNGGIFDGVLGVYAGLEAVRAMRAADVAPTRPVDVVCFTEEEGTRFADGLLGSSVAAGHRSVEEALALTDAGGETLREALEAIGYHGEDHLDASEWDAWLELHVEQARTLERAGVPVGVVTTIAGVTHCDVDISGTANHAGSTPMDERRDALTAASELVLEVERAARAGGEESALVGTVGSLDVSPGAVNVVPGEVSLGVDVRDTEEATITGLVERIEERLDRLEVARGVETSLTREFYAPPTELSERLRTALHEAGDRTGIETTDLHSGAFHDTMYVADVTDAALVFAPSEGGYSHSPREWTDWEDCARATAVLAEALVSLTD